MQRAYVNRRAVKMVNLFLLSKVFFFFFQAEDGIRDLTVTGVQTCALPICVARSPACWPTATPTRSCSRWLVDRKSTRLNSSHSQISYAVFCLKKKNQSYSYS